MQPPSLPNVLPSPRGRSRIAFVMPFPSADDVRIGKALSGCGGALLRGVLAAIGVALDDCALCYVCQHAIGSFESVGWESDVVQQGIAQLATDLATWKPNVVVALDDPRLGSGATHLLHAGNIAPPRTGKKGYAWPATVSKWRGSLFVASTAIGAHPGVEYNNHGGLGMTLYQPFKATTTYAPAFIATVGYGKLFDLRSDVRRARDESLSPQLNLPQLDIAYGPCE